MRQHPLPFTIMAIDPGNNMGICIAEIDGATQTLKVIESITLVIDKALKFNDYTLWQRFTKWELTEFYLDDVLTPLLNHHNVDAVIFESAFHAASIVAYEALLFYGRVIKDVSMEYDYEILIESKTPSNIKKINKVDGRSGDKNLMTDAVRNNPQIILPEHIVLDDLTEHAIDAIAIAYSVVHDMVEALPPL